MSKAALDSLYTEYSVAVSGADYDTAISALMRMQGLLATMPDIDADRNSSKFHDAGMRGSDIPGLIAECRKLKAEANAASNGPFQRTNVTYARATT